MVVPLSNEVAEVTGKTVAPEVTGLVSDVCWEREVYLRVVIYTPIVNSGRGLGTEVSVLEILLQGVAGTTLVSF